MIGVVCKLAQWLSGDKSCTQIHVTFGWTLNILCTFNGVPMHNFDGFQKVPLSGIECYNLFPQVLGIGCS